MHARSSSGNPVDVAALRIRSLDADDPDRPRRAVRVYLEAVLLQEFGQSLLEDPGFPSMLDSVQQQIGEEPELAAAAEKVAGVLLERSRLAGRAG